MTRSAGNPTMNRCHIIAEIGVNHDGSLEKARCLVDAAVEAGADSVKFQHFRVANLVAPGAEKAAYQAARDRHATQQDMLDALRLEDDELVAIAEYCSECGIDFLCTPFDLDSATLLDEMGVHAFKIGSGDLTFHALLKHLASFGKPVILSTGMADLNEVARAVEVLSANLNIRESKEGAFAPICLLHCTSSYPAEDTCLNLRAILTLKEHFGIPVGYSDHSSGIVIAPAAVAIGARILEKHLTLDKQATGPDHAASVEPDEFKAMVANIRRVELALGDGTKAPSPAELEMRKVARRSLFACRALHPGHKIEAEDLIALRPGRGISPADTDSVVGRTVGSTVRAGDMLKWNNLE